MDRFLMLLLLLLLLVVVGEGTAGSGEVEAGGNREAREMAAPATQAAAMAGSDERSSRSEL